MALIPREVAKHHFAELAKELQGATALQAIWKVVDANFPIIGVHVMHEDGKPLLGLALDARDWPHRPFSVRACTLDFRSFIKSPSIPQLHDETGERHIYDPPKSPESGAYFCAEGTREFHDDYGHIIPWEAVRKRTDYTSIAIVNNCVSLIDRQAARGVVPS